jgi:hypothetical protein
MKLAIISACLTLVLSGCFSAHNKDRAFHEVREYSPQGKLVKFERWEDYHKGGGVALLADPKASALDREHINQSALGGQSELRVGEISSVVSTNGIKATGDAAGQFIGEIGKALAK